MMEKILSFQIDHTKLTRGMYLSRVDGDIDTFDLRTRLPNREPVMENGAMHTIEHLLLPLSAILTLQSRWSISAQWDAVRDFIFDTWDEAPKGN